MNLLKATLIFISITLLPLTVSGYDFGKALDNALDRTIRRSVNKTTGSISDAIVSQMPTLDPNAKKDDGEEYDLETGVTIFGFDGCPHCRNAYKFLNENNVEYTLMDTQKDAKAKRLASENGISGVPVIFIEGERQDGYSEQNYRKLLEKHGKL